MKALHSGYGPRADFCWQQDHTALGHPPVLTAASDAAFLVTFSSTTRLPVGHEIHSNDSNAEGKNEEFLFLSELFSVTWFSTGSGKRWHCIAAELGMNGWEWAESDEAGTSRRHELWNYTLDSIKSHLSCSAGHEELRWVSACKETQFLNFHKKINTLNSWGSYSSFTGFLHKAQPSPQARLPEFFLLNFSHWTILSFQNEPRARNNQSLHSWNLTSSEGVWWLDINSKKKKGIWIIWEENNNKPLLKRFLHW